MADNFLERRMDELRAPRRQCVSSQRQLHNIPWRIPQLRVIITGGASGIGRATAIAFADAGCRVTIFDINDSAGRELSRTKGIRFCHVDLKDVSSLENAVEQTFHDWRDVDVIINNAGIFDQRPIEEQSLEQFESVVYTNMRPAYLLAHAWAKHRSRFPATTSYGGRVINIASTRHLQSEEATEAYSASKGALVSMTHSLMMSLSKYDITVNSISPGWIDTADDSLISDADRTQHPSRRVGQPEDIARVCLFLALPENDFINGADIVVDGGMTHKMIYV